MRNLASPKRAHRPTIGLRQDRRRKDKDMIETQKAFQSPVDPDIRAMTIAEFEQIKAGF